jgi:O-antigen/teichoic acid export membrane protein
MLAGYSAMGLGVTASRMFAEKREISKELNQPIGALWLTSICMGTAFSLTPFLAPQQWIVGGLNIPIWMFSLGIFSIAIGIISTGAIVGLERNKDAAIVALATSFILTIGITISAHQNSEIGAMSSIIGASFAQSIGNTAIVLRYYPKAEIFCKNWLAGHHFFKVWKYTGPMVGVSILAASGSWLVGRIILDQPNGEMEFSLYSIGLQWFALALFIPGMVSRALLPIIVKTSDHTRVQDDASTKRLVKSSAILTAVSTSIVCLLTLLIKPWLGNIYGTTYQSVGWLITAFMIAAIPLAPANTIGNAIVARDGQSTWLFITVAWFATLICMAFTFVSYGALSGAIAHGVSACILTVISVIAARRMGLL